jgi:hypothetical protein
LIEWFDLGCEVSIGRCRSTRQLAIRKPCVLTPFVSIKLETELCSLPAGWCRWRRLRPQSIQTPAHDGIEPSPLCVLHQLIERRLLPWARTRPGPQTPRSSGGELRRIAGVPEAGSPAPAPQSSGVRRPCAIQSAAGRRCRQGSADEREVYSARCGVV